MTEPGSAFQWNEYCDQPDIIRDKQFKRRLRLLGIPGHLKTLATNLAVMPLVLANFLRRPSVTAPKPTNGFFGLCVNQDKVPEQVPTIIKELGVEQVLVRIPLSQIDALDQYVAFIASLGDVNVCVNILQDRRHIENPLLLRSSLRKIFSALADSVVQFQIGNAINRLKWAFISIEEYLKFFQVAQSIRDNEFPGLCLIGSSVIDFEPLITVRSLFHGYSAKYDKVAALLYVDRCGAPENKQYLFFDLRRKIRFIMSAIQLSPKADNKLIITESNWPLIDTFPYSPTKDSCCVSEHEAANYLVRYYLEALSTGAVETIYWHQLIAPGYGLMDNREEELRPHAAYYAFKTMLSFLSEARFESLEASDHQYCMRFARQADHILVLWSTDSCAMPACDADEFYDQYGRRLRHLPELLGPAVIYAIQCHLGNSG